MSDDTAQAPVSAELLWSLIERKAEEDEEFRLNLLSFVILKGQSTIMAGRLLDMLGQPRDHKHPEEINPLSMFYQVGLGTLETTVTPEEIAKVSALLKGVLDLVLSGNDPALLTALHGIAPDAAPLTSDPGASSTAPADPDPDA